MMQNNPVTLPQVQYRRGKQPLTRRLIRPVTAPFKDVLGGPDLDECTHHQVDCGSLEIEFYRPRAVIGAGDGYPRQVSLADDETFDRDDSEERTGHQFVKLAGSNWAYRPPRITLEKLLPIPREPYVIVTAFWQLEKVKNGIQLEVGNAPMLEQYLRDDYFAYLESEGGENWQIRKDFHKEYGPEGTNSPQEMIDSFIGSCITELPTSFNTINFNERPWVRYNWTPKHNYPRSLLYTSVLTPETLFTVRFHLAEMLGGSLKHWWSPLVEDTEILMQGVKVHYRELPAAPGSP